MRKSFEINEEKILIKSYWFYANILAIIQGNPYMDNWILNNYIQLISPKIDKPLFVGFHEQRYRDHMSKFNECPLIEFQKIMVEKNRREVMGMDLIDYIKYEINKKNVVLLMVDRHYLKNYNVENPGYIHELMIYGYDDLKQKFLYIDHKINGKYCIDLTCSYSELMSGFQNVKFNDYHRDMTYSIYSMGCNNYQYDLNLNKIKTMLKLYIYPELDYYPRNDEIPAYLGIDVYNAFLNRIDKILSENEYEELTVHSFQVLCDHKKVMLYRIKVLSEMKLIDTNFREKLQNIENDTIILRNLYLKYDVCRNGRVLNECIEYIKQIKFNEYEVMNNIIREI